MSLEKKVGRPCHGFWEGLNDHFARLTAPPQGWEALARDKKALSDYLDVAQAGHASTEEERSDDEVDGRILEVESAEEDQ